MQPHYTPTPKDLYRFWSKVDRSQGDDACWIWTAAKKDKRGYGSLMWAKRRNRYAHRVSWEIAHGDPPGDLLVCHKCDNPSCVNPKHLFLGAYQDNMNDKIAKGRIVRGEKWCRAKLTDAQVAEIRQRYVPWEVSQRKLAKEYGVTQKTILTILKGFRP